MGDQKQIVVAHECFFDVEFLAAFYQLLGHFQCQNGPYSRHWGGFKRSRGKMGGGGASPDRGGEPPMLTLIAKEHASATEGIRYC